MSSSPLVSVPRAPITIGIAVTFMFHCFVEFSNKVKVLISLFAFFPFYPVVNWNSKVHYSLLFLLIITRSVHLAEIRWSGFFSQNTREVCVSISRTDSGLCVHHLFLWSNINFLHNSRWITFPTQSCLVSYSFCANLLHSLIMWMFFSSLSPYNLHLLFYFVLSILALIWLVLIALFYAAIWRHSVSLSTFPFLSLV